MMKSLDNSLQNSQGSRRVLRAPKSSLVLRGTMLSLANTCMRAHMHMRILKQRAGLLNSNTCILYCRIPQLCPPFVHASIRQNRGGGLFTG